MSNEIYIDNVGKFTKRYRSLHCLPDVMRRSVGWNIKLQVSIRLSRWPSLFSSVLVPTPKPIPTLTVQSFDKAWVQIHSDKFNSRGLSWNVKRYFKCLKVRHFVTTVLLVCGSIVASAAVPVSFRNIHRRNEEASALWRGCCYWQCWICLRDLPLGQRHQPLRQQRHLQST